MKREILVTGGLGFIGSHTVVELHNSGYTPIIVDNLSNSEISTLNGLEKILQTKPVFYEGNFADTKLINKILKTHKISGVIHFAAFKAVNESLQEPLKYYQNNVAGFIKLLEILAKHNISNLVFSSSCTVYGEPDKLPITESAPFKPAESPYGASKQMCEIILKDAQKAGLIKTAIALRYFNPIGAHKSGLIGELPIGIPANLVPYVSQTASKIRKEIVINGNDYPTPDGTCIRDYIHVVDLAKAHVKALDLLFKNPKFYDAVNIGTGKGTSVLEIINQFIETNKVDVPYKVGPRRAGDIIEIYASTSKANKLLNWSTELSVKDALADVWRWQQNI